MKTERQKKHAKYLASTEWARIRVDLFATRGEKCEVCSSTSRIQVHHLTYDNWMEEEPGDLIILCGSCHGAEHGIKKKKTKRTKKKRSRAKRKIKTISKNVLQKHWDKKQRAKKMPMAEVFKRCREMDIKIC